MRTYIVVYEAERDGATISGQVNIQYEDDNFRISDADKFYSLQESLRKEERCSVLIIQNIITLEEPVDA